MRLNSIVNWGLSSLSAVVKAERNLGLPVHLTIEPTNICNLRCPVCETGAGVLNRPKGYMSLDAFKKILSRVGEQVNTLLFYYMGEPFLNRDSYAMIKYATRKGIYVSACTNGEVLDMDGLAESRLSEISFQIGGITQKTHETYRVGGDLGKTMNNLSEVIVAKSRGQISTKIQVGFIVMRHNEHEVERAKRKLEAMGVDETVIISPCVRTLEQGEQFLPTDDKYWCYDRKAFAGGDLIPRRRPNNRCWWIYYSTVVLWDGSIVPCCRDTCGHHTMGNLLEQNMKEIWNGDRYRSFRYAISVQQRKLPLCRLCSGYGIARLY